VAEDIKPVQKVLRHVCNDFLKKQNVVAVGIGYKISGGIKSTRLSIICSVEQKLSRAQLYREDLIPQHVNGVVTDVVETGRMRALAIHRQRHRPAPGGVSIAHRDVTAGTLGCVVKKNGQHMILSNNHVLANSNAAQVGDAILQPGSFDGGTFPGDHIANLFEFIPINLSGGSGLPSNCSIARRFVSMLNIFAAISGSRTRLQAVSIQTADNLVDAAIAKPLADNDISTNILDIGDIGGMRQGLLGMAIQKSGRTTEHTTGLIDQVDVTVDVQYGGGQVGRFTDQILAGPMSQGGDSGSVVLDTDNNLIGLLFAGSDTTTIINRMEHVFSALDLSL